MPWPFKAQTQAPQTVPPAQAQPMPAKKTTGAAHKRKTTNPSLPTANAYIPAQPFQPGGEDPAAYGEEINNPSENHRIIDCPVPVDAAMGADMASHRLADLQDPDKFSVFQGHDQKTVLTVVPTTSDLTLSFKGPLGNLLGGETKMEFYWEDVKAIHCYGIVTGTDNPQTVYQCGLEITGSRKPLVIRCASSAGMVHMVSALEYFIRTAQGGKAAPLGSLPYLNQGVRLGGEGVVDLLWDNSPAGKAGIRLNDAIWCLGPVDLGAPQGKKNLEAGLQALAPGRHELYLVTAADWLKAKADVDIHSVETFNPPRHRVMLDVP
jgi:hypothetical protein